MSKTPIFLLLDLEVKREKLKVISTFLDKREVEKSKVV